MAPDISALERDALDDGIKVSRLLHQTLAFTTRMGDMAMAEWATKELNGYEGDEECPDYRHVHGQIVGCDTVTGTWKTVHDHASDSDSVLEQLRTRRRSVTASRTLRRYLRAHGPSVFGWS